MSFHRRNPNNHAHLLAPLTSEKTVRSKRVRRASLAFWGKNDISMVRAAADINVKELMLTVQQRKYDDHEKATRRAISSWESQVQEDFIRQQRVRRARLLSRFRAKKDFLAAWETEGQAKWKANQAILYDYERRLLSYELAVRARAAAQQRIRRNRCADDTVHGTRWFEKNIERLGLDPGSTLSSGDGGAADCVLVPDNESQATFRAKLLRTVLDQKFIPGSNAQAMAELRSRGKIIRRARHERMHRRLKIEVDQRLAKAETDAKRAESERLKHMLEAGRERRAEAAAYLKRCSARQKKAISQSENSVQATAAQHRAFEAAFNKTAADARERFYARKHKRDAAAEELRFQRRLHIELKRKRTNALCKEIALKIVDLVVVASGARAERGGVPLPPSTWTLLVRRFCSSEPFFTTTTTEENLVTHLHPAFQAKERIQHRNLERCEGMWRPYTNPGGISLPEVSPLDHALSIARYLVEINDKGPREPPSTYFGSTKITSNNDIGHGLSVKLVLLPNTTELEGLCAELGMWTGLYCCNINEALECAMIVGADLAAADKSRVDGKKARKSRSSGHGEQAEAGNSNDQASRASETEKTGEEKDDAVTRGGFHPEANEEDVAMFKEAAIAYHALRKDPKKAASPVPLALTTSILVKHLACQAPPGKGWILVGYPRCRLEAKLLENALTGFTDVDVMAELGGGAKVTKPDAKKRKVSAAPTAEVPRVPQRSGLDAVLTVPTVYEHETRPNGYSDSRQVKQADGANADTMSIAHRGGGEKDPPCIESKDHGLSSSADKIKASVVTNSEPMTSAEAVGDISLQYGEVLEWWSQFDSGNLCCEVPQETTNERLIESLFLLAIIAQMRKVAHERWLAGMDDAIQSTLPTDSAMGSGDAIDADGDALANWLTDGESSFPEFHSSPLEISLISPLEALWARRRCEMCHNTRVRMEALCVERELDLSGIKALILKAEGRGGNESKSNHEGVSRGTAVAGKYEAGSLYKLEMECMAFSLIDWLVNAEFYFVSGLRAPDDRWTTECFRLEQEIALIRQKYDVHDDIRERVQEDSGREGHITRLSKEKADHIRDALETFELEAGNIVDDRYATADATFMHLKDEAQARLKAWARAASGAAAEVCETQWAEHAENVELLESLSSFFDLEEMSSGECESARVAAQEAGETLNFELSEVTSGRDLGEGGEELEKEIHLALELLPPSGPPEIFKEREQEVVPTDPAYVDTSASGGHEAASSVDICVGKDPRGREGRNPQPMKAGQGIRSIGTLDNDFTVGHGAGEALTAALWMCRYIHLCRARGIIARLSRSINWCETLIVSTLNRLRRLKRRRVKLEHESVGNVVSALRRAVADSDGTKFRRMLQHGISLRVADTETSVADPRVALPWGLNTLGLQYITSLVDTLRENVAADGSAAADDGPMLPVLVKTWVKNVATRGTAYPLAAEVGLPPSWALNSNDFVDKLCRAVARGVSAPWRRLMHCLLLGHVAAFPTIEELRVMRHIFQSKASSQARPSSEPCDKLESPGLGGCSVPPVQGLSLRLAQQHMKGIRLWFEDDSANLTKDAPRAVEGGKDSRSDTLAIKDVYMNAWREADDHLDALDLLLTICSVPDEELVTAPLQASRGDDNGIPFSLGLFRAFSMLEEEQECSTESHRCESPSANADSRTSDSTSSHGLGRVVDSNTGSRPQGGMDQEYASLPGAGPYVSLPQLEAILQHAGMTNASVQEVFNTAWTMDEVLIGRHARQQHDHTVLDDPIVTDRESAIACRVMPNERPAENGASHSRSDETRNEVIVRGNSSKNALAAEPGNECVTEASPLTKDAGKFLDESCPGDEQPYLLAFEEEISSIPSPEPKRVSFFSVSNCPAVRTTVRGGAFTLPSRWVTLDQFPDCNATIA